MSYQFAVSPALQQVQAYIFCDLSAQGEAPATLPFAFTAEQYNVDVANLPQTIIEVQKIDFVRKEAPSLQVCLDLIIHHIRQRDGASNQELIAIDRLCHIAASLENDIHMLQYNETTNNTLEIQMAGADQLLVGMQNPVQMALDSTEQLSGLCAVSCPVRIVFRENKY